METTDERLFDPHPSVRARLVRSAGSCPPPGSLEEAEALAAIDEARWEEEDARTYHPGRSRRRMRKHWSERQAQLDGR